ncbi:MAG: ATP-binding protein [Myxococcota bacterium]
MSDDASQLAAIFVERSPNGILVCGPNGRLRVVNPAVREMIPLVPDPIGRLPGEAVPIPEIAAALTRPRSQEQEFELPHGGRDLLVRIVPMGQDDGQMVILQDVTRLKQEERYRAEFVGNVSHELRTPTTSIVGYSETLLEERDRLAPDLYAMIETIHRNALRLSALFEDLLSLARLDGTRTLPTVSISVSSIFREVIDKWSPSASERGISFQTAVPRGLKVSGHYPALVHVVGNLVENAVKYSDDNGLVTLRSWTRGGRVCLEVIDLGIGMEPSQHKRIFERFYRVDKSRSRAAGGTGLGLALVKRLADIMQAEIEVRSAPGKGSVFRVWMPPAIDEAPEG